MEAYYGVAKCATERETDTEASQQNQRDTEFKAMAAELALLRQQVKQQHPRQRLQAPQKDGLPLGDEDRAPAQAQDAADGLPHLRQVVLRDLQHVL